MKSTAVQAKFNLIGFVFSLTIPEAFEESDSEDVSKTHYCLTVYIYICTLYIQLYEQEPLSMWEPQPPPKVTIWNESMEKSLADFEQSYHEKLEMQIYGRIHSNN